MNPTEKESINLLLLAIAASPGAAWMTTSLLIIITTTTLKAMVCPYRSISRITVLHFKILESVREIMFVLLTVATPETCHYFWSASILMIQSAAPTPPRFFPEKKAPLCSGYCLYIITYRASSLISRLGKIREKPHQGPCHVWTGHLIPLYILKERERDVCFDLLRNSH